MDEELDNSSSEEGHIIISLSNTFLILMIYQFNTVCNMFSLDYATGYTSKLFFVDLMLFSLSNHS